MRTLLFVLLVACFTSFTGCAKKEWNKNYVTKKCIKSLDDEPDLKGKLTTEQTNSICDCVADRMLAKYKSEAESEKDQGAAEMMGQECAIQVLQPQQPQ